MSKQRRKTAAGKRPGPRKTSSKTSNKASKATKPRAKATTARTRKTRAPVASQAAPRGSLDQFIDAAAAALALPVEPAWKPAVKANLELTLRFAALVNAFPLPDESEPAPVFVA